MKVFNRIDELKSYLKALRVKNTIGLVPTMGALHQGHLSLITFAKDHCDISIATIFINPTQFDKEEDLNNYPITIDKDLSLLKSIGTDVVFIPSQKEIYPITPQIKLSFGSIEEQLEGKFRKGHFAGVGLIVSKLFNMISPDHAFFGQKDLQQFFIIKKLIEELNFNISIHMAPIVRENNGLAMSSRNQRLSNAQFDEASLLYQALEEAKTAITSGQSITHVKNMVQELFYRSSSLELEYFEVVDTSDFFPLREIKNQENIALCIAAEIGKVRLIDNLLLID